MLGTPTVAAVANKCADHAHCGIACISAPAGRLLISQQLRAVPIRCERAEHSRLHPTGKRLTLPACEPRLYRITAAPVYSGFGGCCGPGQRAIIVQLAMCL